MRTVDNETLVFDLESRETLCLDPTLATIWAQCDGATTIDDLARLTESGEKKNALDLAWIAVEQLRAKGLLVPESLGNPAQNRFHGLSRREMIMRSGLIGAAIPTLLAMQVPNGVVPASLVCDCLAPVGSNARPNGCACVADNDCCGTCASGACTGLTEVGAPACCPSILA